MYSAPSACTCLCLHFLLLCFQVQVLVAEENVDFRIHVENQTRARDDVSRKQLRLYQLYSRTSGKHIQVLGRRISARGEDGDKYAPRGDRHLREPGPDQGQGDRVLPMHESQRQARGQARWHQQGVCVHRESAREQLHGPDVSQVHGLVRGLHQEGAAPQGPQDPGEPAGRALHEALPQGASRAAEALQVHHGDQAVTADPPHAPRLGPAARAACHTLSHRTAPEKYFYMKNKEEALFLYIVFKRRQKLNQNSRGGGGAVRITLLTGNPGQGTEAHRGPCRPTREDLSADANTEKPKSFFPKVLKAKKNKKKQKKGKEKVAPLPPTSSPHFFPVPDPCSRLQQKSLSGLQSFIYCPLQAVPRHRAGKAPLGSLRASTFDDRRPRPIVVTLPRSQLCRMLLWTFRDPRD
ncbi:fibroblast growth factor 18 isoform X1 [Castor canadensis]|uniref:Fibroblast growth factor 18 isoform X1 n=1 Tax=Castor canadensis TaxID=51338 RepID=A0AC58L9Q2_CASCN